MAKYMVEWQMGGEAIFESDDGEDAVGETASSFLSDGIAWDVSDDINRECGDKPISSHGSVEYTVRKI